jgi:hypothetical protein
MQIDKNNWQIKVNEENREELEDYFIPKSSFLYFRLVINNWYGYIDGEMIAENDRTPYLKCIDIYQFRKYILGKDDSKFKVGDKVKIIDYPSVNLKFLLNTKHIVSKVFDDGTYLISGYKILEQLLHLVIGNDPKFKKGDKVRIGDSDRVYIVKSIGFNEYGIYYCFECGSCATENILCLVPQKIIGYKAPFDMWDKHVKEGDTLVLYPGDVYSLSKGHEYDFVIPKEVVEAFFIPVYEEEEKVIELHGWKVTKDKILNIEGRDCRGLIFKCFKEYSEIIKAYEELNK